MIDKSVRAYRSTDQAYSAPYSVPRVAFDVALSDTGGFWSAGDPTKLVVPETGSYLVGFYIAINWNAPYRSFNIVYLNNITGVFVSKDTGNAPDQQRSVGRFVYYFTAGDYVTLGLHESTGQTGTIKAQDAYAPCLWIAKVKG